MIKKNYIWGKDNFKDTKLIKEDYGPLLLSCIGYWKRYEYLKGIINVVEKM